jgi:RNA polymerase sigma factor (sigma-70 family)
VSADSKGGEEGDAHLVELHALVRRVVGARVRDADTVDDLTQETLARVLAARGRVDDAVLAPYAVVTARNLVRSLARREERRRRHSHRLIGGTPAPSPEEEVTREEERTALALAWSKLDPEERRALAAHEIEGADIAAHGAAVQSDAGCPRRSPCPHSGQTPPRIRACSETSGTPDGPLPTGAVSDLRR